MSRWLRLFVVPALLVCGAGHASTLNADGEVYARHSATLVPPNIEDLWQFNITQLADDGAPVKKGDVVLGFDGSQVMKNLVEKQNKLKEKQSELGKLRLDLAERERDSHLATAQARAEQDKARRKTAQPAELIGGIAYRKLMVARQQTEQKLALTQRRELLAAEQRRQELRLLTSETAQLQREVTQLQNAMAQLNVVAPRDGLMLHRSGFNGDKFDVGSQVWRGQPVADIPDGSSLAVRAQLPERDLRRVALGIPVRIVIEGGAGSVLRGRISRIGRAVRSKSSEEPVPVVDVEVVLDNPRARLRPGQAVRVEWTAVDGATAGSAKGAR